MSTTEMKVPVLFEDVEQLEHKVRTDDAETSWIAAAGLDRKGELDTREAVFEIVRRFGPITHEAIHAKYIAAGKGKRTEQRIRTVASELERAGRIRADETNGRTSNGGQSRRWVVKVR